MQDRRHIPSYVNAEKKNTHAKLRSLMYLEDTMNLEVALEALPFVAVPSPLPLLRL
jgi:hypothetical protein